MQDTVAELFQDEVEDDRGAGGGGSPTPPSQYASQANAGYEIPARLRTLHNLVIQYASQGQPTFYLKFHFYIFFNFARKPESALEGEGDIYKMRANRYPFGE